MDVKTAPIEIFLHGATGRMGRAIASLIPKIEGVRLRGMLKLRHSGTERSMPESAGVPVLTEIPKRSGPGEVVVDFSHAEAVEPLVRAMAGTGLPVVCGTTGINSAERDLLNYYSEESPVFYDENMSYGIAVLKWLLRTAAPMLTDSADVEIVEFHHRGKVDFPSGTAIGLARAIAPDTEPIPGRGDSAHPESGHLHIHSVRVGGIPGEHQVHFATDEEVITLSHRALSRNVFARGAIRAAQFVVNRDKGFFTMSDLLEEHGHV
jgi:4-hydroxy-tetrahydrodipicolinate reductase